jgi:ATP-binding cassette subfamily C protein LapB
VDSYIEPHQQNWFRRFAARDLRPYGYVLVASLIANALSLAGVMFSMQVYDRVVPASSMSTLYVLFAGVMLAIGFDFVVRRVRGSIIDILGKRCDMRMSDLLFGHALRVKTARGPNRPAPSLPSCVISSRSARS